VSEFANAALFVKGYLNQARDALNNTARAKWSTSIPIGGGVPATYQAALELLASKETATEVAKLYQVTKGVKAEASTGGTASADQARASAAVQMGLRQQVHFIDGLRRAYRTKFIAGADDQKSHADYLRADFVHKQVSVAMVERIRVALTEQTKDRTSGNSNNS
jgi:hypothetical protein